MLYSLLAVTLALVVQQPSTEAPITPPGETASAILFANDARLAKTITLSEPAITLNDALKQITNQTGVPLKMRDRKLLGEQKICVYATTIPARQFLESVAALLRYRNTTSEWQKDATGDGYALSVGRPSSAKRSAQEASAEPAAAIALAQLIPPDAVPDTVNRISVTVNADSPAQEFSVVTAEDVPIRLSTPEQEKRRKQMIDDWFTRYDLRASDKDNKAIPQVEASGDNGQNKSAPTANSVTRLLADIARKENIPVVALLPTASVANEESFVDHPVDSSSSKTLAIVLNGLTAPPFQFRYKWHKGSLLLRDPLSLLP